MTKRRPSKLQLSVGPRIKELREQRDWTQEQLAEKLDVTARHLQRVEAGEKNLTLTSIERIAKALGVRPRDVVDVPIRKR